MRRLNQRGVTLVELMLAMLLLGVALIGLAASFPLAMVGVSMGGFQTTATLLGQQCIDIAKSMNYEVTGYNQIPTALPIACPDGPVTGYAGFTRTVSVNVTADEAAQSFFTTVTVQIDFSGGAGGINTTTLSTILAR